MSQAACDHKGLSTVFLIYTFARLHAMDLLAHDSFPARPGFFLGTGKRMMKSADMAMGAARTQFEPV